MTTAARSQSRTPGRVPGGVPTGGQFTASARAEAPVTLGQAIDETFPGDRSGPSHPDGSVTPTVPSPVTVDYTEMPQTTRESLENRDVVDCPICWGSGLVPRKDEACGFCDHGFVTQADLEEYVEAGGSLLPNGYGMHRTEPGEPDYEGMVEARAESAFERRGAAVEWGGMDVAS